MERTASSLLALLVAAGCSADGEAWLVDAGRWSAASQSLMVPVPEGEYLAGCGPNDGCSDAASAQYPPEEVFVDAFWMDLTEVTVRQYRSCVEAGACTYVGYTTDGYYDEEGTFYQDYKRESDCNWYVAGHDEHPLNCVNQEEAREYCEWRGARLPEGDEALRSRRGDDARLNPWGNQPPDCTVSHTSWWDAEADLFHGGCGVMSTAEVGTKPPGAGPYGHLDLAGGLRELLEEEPVFDAESHRNRFYITARSRPPLHPLGSVLASPQPASAAIGFRCVSTLEPEQGS